MGDNSCRQRIASELVSTYKKLEIKEVASLQEDNYRRNFTDALKECVVDDRYKYARFTDMIYVSIFCEKAKEYKKILDLKANEKARDTFYSEILDIIAAYESGLADAIRKNILI